MLRPCVRRLVLVGALVGLVSTAYAGDFPRWRGADSNGSAGETAMPLVTSWDDVRVAWVSETKSPHPWNHSVIRGKTQWPRTVLGNGGYCEPTIWDGKVYVAYYRPSGTKRKPATDKWARTGLDAYALAQADEVIVCMDALTGRTLWEAVWEGTELNDIETYGGHNNACVADGRIYTISNAGNLYCADARTGQKLWMVKIGGAEPIAEPALPPHPLGGSLNGNTFNSCPVVADGVVVTGGQGGSTSLVGYDAVTGKRAWANPAAKGGLVPPLRWVHEGKEYLIAAAGGLQCIEPKTGNILWSQADGGTNGHDASTPAIWGDYLITHGPSLKDLKSLPPNKQFGWVCYKLTPTGATQHWGLSTAYVGTGYIAAVAHRGYAWLKFMRAEGATGMDDENPDGKANAAIVCVEIATGKVISEVNGFPMLSVCPGPMAMGDLLAYQGDKYVWLIDISNPAAPKLLGVKPQPSNYCSSITGADGFLYFRSAERLVTCLDVRRPDARPAPTPGDLARARFDLTLEGGLRDGGTPRLFARATNGAFPQTWATVGPDHAHPDVLYPGTLRLDGHTLAGEVSALLGGTPYGYKLNATLKNGAVEGEYEDTYRGVPMKGDVTGTAVAIAERNATFSLTWPRHWIDGGNQGAEHKLYMTLKDGVIVSAEVKPRIPGRAGFTAKTEAFELSFTDSKLAGYIIVQMTVPNPSIGVSGRYRVDIDATLANNLFTGSVKSTRDAYATTTHHAPGFVGVHGGGQKPTTTHEAWGDASIPATEAFTPGNAVYTLDLKKSLIAANAVESYWDMRLLLTMRDGKAAGAIAIAQATAGTQRVDASGLRVEGDRLKGRVTVSVVGDGYAHRTSSFNVYEIDVPVVGNTANGTYGGTFDFREPRRGRITGAYVTE